MATGKLERYSPGTGTVALHREHEARYQFASARVRSRRVLDIASGSGMGTSLLLRAGASNVTGVDISLEAIEYADRHFPGPRYMQGDGCKIPLQDASVDVVVSFETIEHLKDTAGFLKECCRVLVPGGTFIGSTPNEPIFTWLNGLNEFHLTNFSSRQFEQALRADFLRRAVVRAVVTECAREPGLRFSGEGGACASLEQAAAQSVSETRPSHAAPSDGV